MIYFDAVGNNTIRMSNSPGGAGKVRFLSDNIAARSDELGRIWVQDLDADEPILNSYSLSDISIDEVVYNTVGEFMEAFNVVLLGSLLNYLKSFLTYKTRVETDSGTVNDETLTKDIYKDLPAQDSIVFAWIGGAGSKKRTSTIYSFFTKLYDMFLPANDATQTTEASQPYVSGNIAPNEVECLKNPNGNARYVTHPEISFAADEAWSVSAMFNFEGGYNNYETLFATNAGNSAITLGWGANNFITIRSDTGVVKITTVNNKILIGKNKLLTIIADGNGSLSFYIDAVFHSTYETHTSIKISRFMRSGVGVYPFLGTFSSYFLRSVALTPTQVTQEHTLLRSKFPEIPSVQIGTEDIATSSLEMVSSTNGTVITQAADNTDWATGAARWCYHNADSAVGAIYGKLYNKAARDVIIANPPSGWHVATEAELTALALNGGNALKFAGTDYWNTTGGTNSTGFTALGGSSRNADGTFNAIKDHAGFWCADSDKVLKVYHDSDTAEVVAVTSVNEGFSIRLIKD